MKPNNKGSVMDAVSRLRSEVLARADGSLLGSEDELQALLGVSRPTVRQAARLLEREGLLRVRRGNAGGYFVSRPAADFIEETVSTYLESLHASSEDLTAIASVLWIEAVRRAAALGTEAARNFATRFREKVRKFPDEVGSSELLSQERTIQTAIFKLIESPYVQLIFNINANYAGRILAAPSIRDDSAQHREFVRAWRKAKLMELDAIASGDEELAVLAARRTRDLIHRRLWS